MEEGGEGVKYGSVCSGIEAASVAWHPLGWEPAFFSEIEAFPSAVLSHHYPETPNYGDMTKFKEWPNANIDVLVGGTPCQSFSVAGLRKGLDDPRGNLMLTFGAVAAKYRPTWLVWENVPGVLSANGGRDFGTFLGMLGQLGYGFAYRVLDAQYTGLAQRRKRVFVVANIGGWRSAAAVLFERHSLSGDIAPSREAREVAPGFTSSSFGGYREGVGTVRANGGDVGPGSETLTACMSTGKSNAAVSFESCPALTCNEPPIAAKRAWPAEITPTLNASFADKMGLEDQHALNGAGCFIPAVMPINTQMATREEQAIAFEWQSGLGISEHKNICPALIKSQTPAVGFTQNQRDEVRMVGVAGALAAEPGAKQQTYTLSSMAVRRLTPTEYERLQGFPDGYTQIPYRKKPAENCPDGPRYKALGNSMAVPCMAWIGQRIQAVEDIYSEACEVLVGMNVGEAEA